MRELASGRSRARRGAVEKVKRLIEGRARAIAEERLKAMAEAGSKPAQTEDG